MIISFKDKIEWDAHLLNINRGSNVCFQGNIINTSSVQGDNQTAESMQIWGTACGLNTVHDLEWMCSQSANQLVMLGAIVSKLIPWVARGKFGLYCIPTQQRLFFAGSQSRLIKQHYCKRSIDRKKKKNICIVPWPSLFDSKFSLKAHTYHNIVFVCTKRLNEVLMFGPCGCALSCSSFCAKMLTQGWKNMLYAAGKYYIYAELCISTPCCILSDESKRQSIILIWNQSHKGLKSDAFCADS